MVWETFNRKYSKIKKGDKMKIKNGKITLLFNEEGAVLELTDSNASIMFIEIHLSNKQVCQMLSRLAHTDCKSMEVFNLNKVGKIMENIVFKTELSKSVYDKRNIEEIKKLVNSKVPKGWKSDNYFGSRNSFFETDGRYYASCTIRKWR